MVSSTPEGTGWACRPIRLIRLPHPPARAAADAASACVVAGHQALGSRHDCGAHATEHARHVAGGDVDTAAGLRDALQAGDDRRAALGVLELNVQLLADAGALDRVAHDVALLLQDP